MTIGRHRFQTGPGVGAPGTDCVWRARAIIRAGVLAVVIFIASCGQSESELAPVAPTANPARAITDTGLAFDLNGLTASADITFAPDAAPGATLEVGDLSIRRVIWDGNDLPYHRRGTRIDLGLPAADRPLQVRFEYRWRTHENYDGASSDGYTYLWPYFCGNLFPCHSDPADGTRFTLTLTGIPAGQTAIYPRAIATAAPSYQIAWAVGVYAELPLGTTLAGTKMSVWFRDGEESAARQGSAHLLAAFDWLERTIGPYRFGDQVAAVSVPSRNANIEHHPYWHISSHTLANEELNVHEAAHGWFGAGVRIACWEDFVLSEGTTSYLTARALDAVAPQLGTQVWQGYRMRLASVPGAAPVWPQSCGAVDILNDALFSDAPYMRGAFFFKALADRVGATQLDAALARFYRERRDDKGAARMSGLLASLKEVTGYDPSTCARIWLSDAMTPLPGPCP